LTFISDKEKMQKKYYLLIIIFGIVTTVLMYSGYGIGNHIEQLPIILRSLDNNYLQNDFFTNAGENFFVRHLYTTFISFIAGSESSLPFVFLIITLFANISTSFITFFTAQHIFNKSIFAGLFASAFVMSVFLFNLDESPTLFFDILIPTTIAIPFTYGAILSVIRGNLVVGFTLAGIATIFHPLIGLEIGGILFITVIIFQVIKNRKIKKDILLNLLLGMLVLLIFSLFSMSSYFSNSRIDSDLFIFIVAIFRHPHHYIPSTFSLIQYSLGITFLLSIYLIYYRNFIDKEKDTNFFIGILITIILLLCVGGYLFVEIFPSRIWVSAQTFRLLYVVKWIGLIYVAGTISVNKIDNSRKVINVASIMNPITFGVIQISLFIRESIILKYNKKNIILDLGIILLIAFSLIGYLVVPIKTIFLLCFYALLILGYFKISKINAYLTFLICMTTGIMLIYIPNLLPNYKESSSPYSISELMYEGDDIAKFAQQNTPEDSIFLTPPSWGQFRLKARRAIVVDFKAFPFRETSMIEWYERIINCYGFPEKTGWLMTDEINNNYKNISDNILLDLLSKYNISYAVLYNQTPTDFEIIFNNGSYKIAYIKVK